MLHCDLRVRWKVASDLRFRAAISEPKTPSFCGISGDLAQSTRKSLEIAIVPLFVRFWCAKPLGQRMSRVRTFLVASYQLLLSRTIFYLRLSTSGQKGSNSYFLRNQEKGVLAKGVSAESSVTLKETKRSRGYWAQQHVWHSERHSQERRTFLQKPPSKNPLFLVPDFHHNLNSQNLVRLAS